MSGRDTRSTGESATRRRVLGACATAITTSLAGCLVAGAPNDCGPLGPPPNGLDLRNTDSSDRAVTVTVIRDLLVAGPTVFEESYELETVYTNEATRVEDVVDLAGRYIVRVEVESDPPVVAEHLWNVSPDGCDGLQIKIDGGRVQFSEPDAIGMV